MTTKTFHMSADVRGLLLRSDRELRGVLVGDNGHSLPPREARLALMEELAQGHERIPAGPLCEGWDWKTGCPGHEKEAEK